MANQRTNTTHNDRLYRARLREGGQAKTAERDRLTTGPVPNPPGEGTRCLGHAHISLETHLQNKSRGGKRE